MDMRKLSKTDPLERQAEKQTDSPEYSPMDPPDAYAPPSLDPVPYEAMPAFLRALMDDHRSFEGSLTAFEHILASLQENGLKPDKSVDGGLREFFAFLDDHVVPHHMREEKILFPVLHERLLEAGEHGAGRTPKTAIDVLEDDHAKAMQHAAVTFNFLGLAARLSDAASRAIVLDAALQQGKALVELLRLHMFREDNIVFALAVRHLSDTELGEMEKRGEPTQGTDI